MACDRIGISTCGPIYRAWRDTAASLRGCAVRRRFTVLRRSVDTSSVDKLRQINRRCGCARRHKTTHSLGPNPGQNPPPPSRNHARLFGK